MYGGRVHMLGCARLMSITQKKFTWNARRTRQADVDYFAVYLYAHLTHIHLCMSNLSSVWQTTTHDRLASELDDVIEEPSKIKLNVAKGLVESCYEPIVQSGGEYDLKVRGIRRVSRSSIAPSQREWRR